MRSRLRERDGQTACVDEPTSAEPGASMSEADLLGVLTETFSILDRWQFVVRSRVEPAENSDLFSGRRGVAVGAAVDAVPCKLGQRNRTSSCGPTARAIR